MQKVELLIGIPGAGKSTYCKSLMQKEPGKWKRINNDSLRESLDFGVWSKENETVIRNVRKFLIKESLKQGFNCVIDNLNLGKRNWEEICSIVKNLNIDCQLYEKHFYIELDEAIQRDSLREGKAKVGEEVIKKWWQDSGKGTFKFYKPRVETFKKNINSNQINSIEQDRSLPKAVIFDNDGTISLIHNRSPYDASTCDNDLPHEHVIECMKLYFNAGYKILFVSGREEKDRAPTERFYAKHFPEVTYELYMRPTADSRKDVIIKEEIYNNYIKNKYFISGWFDDRLQVCEWVYKNGLGLFRVNDPTAVF